MSSTPRAGELLAEWSKWLIGVNAVAAAGCVTVLKLGVADPLVRGFLFGAVCAFAGSLLCAVFLVFLLALRAGAPPGAGLRRLAGAQLALFLLGAALLLAWVYRLAFAA